MKQFKILWASLEDRQKKWIALTAVILGFILYYTLIWEPIHDSVLTLRQQINADQKLLVWMQDAQKTIKRSQAQGAKQNTVTDSSAKSLLTLAEQSVQKQQLAGTIKEIKQIDSGNVQLRFEKVVYVDFIKWLDQFQAIHRVSIEKVRIRHTDVAGTVNADLVINR